MTNKPPFTAEYISNGADARLQPEARELAEQLFFMRAKLEELRKELRDAPLVTEYDNGGQQRGTHVNPVFKAHKDLLITYTKTLSTLEAIIGKKDPGEDGDIIPEMRKRFKIAPAKVKITTDGEVKSYWKAGKSESRERKDII